MKEKLSRRRVLTAIGAGTPLGKAAARFLGSSALMTLTASANAATGYSAVVRMFGSGANYNSDGTITGTPNGAVYSYNPDNPDSHTTVIDAGNFVSDFAGFTQGCVHCIRDDTALRLWFRKDISPNPTRIEIILEYGHFTTTGAIPPNLGPFALQILKDGVPQNIPVNTAAGGGKTWVPGGSTVTGTTHVTTAYFPSMGWWTRWRWNPTPRAMVRTNRELLPANLNLVPNFSNSLATTYNCRNTGTYGQLPYISAYSSAWSPRHQPNSFWSNYNPTGVNESTAILSNMEGPGARPDIGILPEWDSNWVVNSNSEALSSMFVIAEVGGGIPWCLRDSSTGWAPMNLINQPNINLTANLDFPKVTVPSSVGAGTPVVWDVEMNHHPCLGYVPYLLTGDPYYLENLQMYASYCVFPNVYARAGQFLQNGADPKGPYPAPFAQAFGGMRHQLRAWAWTIRTYTAAYLASPTSVPSWLQPRSYFASMMKLNAEYADKWGDAYPGSTGDKAYPSLTALGTMPIALYNEQGFMVQYMCGALAFALNQGGFSSWRNYTQYFAVLPVGWAIGDGVTGWDRRFATPYQILNQPFSTDYNSNPKNFSDLLDCYNYHINNCVYSAFATDNGWLGWNGRSNLAPSFYAWTANKRYNCNSWLFEIRGGCPVTPNVGDVVSMTIAGPFSGSPVTVSHTVTSSDIATLQGLATSLLATGATSNIHPIGDPLIAAVNANRSLAAAGITASAINTVPNAETAGSGAFFSQQIAGRIYLSFNSSNSASAWITVMGSFNAAGGGPTKSRCSLYIAPNGDGVTGVPSSNPALLGRPMSYQVAKTATTGSSGNAPTGTSLQTVFTTGDGVKWCFVPELMSCPLLAPGGSSAKFPQPGFGGPYGTAGMGTSYIVYGPGYMAGLATANAKNLVTIPQASAAYANLKAELDYLFANNPGNHNTFNLSIAP